MKISESSFHCSVFDYKKFKNSNLPEFVFAGKSNVGKSTLINTLVNKKKLAQISKSPGKTKTLNFYLINKKFYFVDLPGYGYAEVSEELRKKWKTMIENYLKNSKNIKIIFILIDIRRGLDNLDLELINFCNYYNFRIIIIFTKCDKISKSKINEQVKKIIEQLNNDKIKIIPFSSKTKLNKIIILKLIENAINKSNNNNLQEKN